MYVLLTNFIIVYLEILETSWMNHKLLFLGVLFVIESEVLNYLVFTNNGLSISSWWVSDLTMHPPPPLCVLLYKYIQVYLYSTYKLLGLHTCIMHNHLFPHGIGVIMGQEMFFTPLLYSKINLHCIYTQNIIIFLVFTDLHRLNFSGC